MRFLEAEKLLTLVDGLIKTAKTDDATECAMELYSIIEGQQTEDAIPVEWLEEKMNKSSGFRHAVLSETIEEWRGVNV